MFDNSFSSVHQYINQNINNNKQHQLSSLRMRWAEAQHRKQLQKKIFGQHFNYNKVSLNKEKKYLIQEEKNTEIERANRILLQKIQRISKRSLLVQHKRNATQEEQPQRQTPNVISKISSHQDRAQSKSHNQISKIGLSPISTALAKRKVLFRVNKQFDSKSFFISTYIEKDRYILEAQWSGNKQKITIDLVDYNNLLQGHLQGNHKGIVALLKFNGTMLEFSGVKKQRILIEENEQVTLPLIGRSREQKFFSK